MNIFSRKIRWTTRLADRGLRLLTILTLVGGGLLQGGGVQVVLAAGADNLASATVLTVPLSNDLTTTTGATSQAGEFGTCGNFPPAPPTDNVHSVWYKYTPGSNGYLSIDTLGSSYDTVLEVFTTTVGSPTFADLTSAACNDDVGAVKQSELTLPVSTAYTYYIVARDYNIGAGGTLDFSASFSAQQQIYVNKTTGSDTNPGSAALPVKSIRCGVKDPSASPCNVTLFSGAVINISAGLYAENVVIDKSLTLTATTPVTATSFTLTNGAVVSGSSGVHAPTVNVNQVGAVGALIQDGVLLASSGGTVNVATGTYTESVTINKNLTLQGSGGPILTQPVGTALTITGGAVTVNDFNIQNSTIGVSVTGGSGHVLFHNNFTGNTTGVSSSGPTVTATSNYWGSSTGPIHSSNPGGTGNVVSNNVIFSPWCTVPAPTCTPLAGIATKLVFTAQPSDEVMNVSITPAIVVKAQDAAGNIGINFNGPVTMTIGVNPGGGALNGTNPVVAVNGVVTFTDLSITLPGIGYTLIAMANLPAGITSTQSITFTIFNNPPDAVDDTFSVAEDSLNNPLDVLLNDVDDDTKIIVAVGPVANGTRIFSSSMVTYTPNADFFGTEVFTYTITDQFQSGTDTAVVTVTVTNVNDPPIAVNDAFTVTEDSLNNPLNVLANDLITPDTGETLSISAVGNPPNGTALFFSTMITYTPNADFFGTEVFTYTISDGNGGFDTATITVTVTNVNDPPIAVDDVFTVTEDSGANVLPVLANDTFAPDVGETLTITAKTNGANGTVAITGGGTGLTYTPNLNYFGPDSFTYTISDGVLTDTAIVTITVTPVNDPPTAVNDTFTVTEDSLNNPLDVLANDFFNPPDVGETLSISAVGNPPNGTALFFSAMITYTPDADFFGTDVFTYTISDGNGGFATGLITVTVTNINDPPIAVDDAATVLEDSGANAILVLTNDNTANPDIGETLTITAKTDGTNGTVAITGGGTGLTYTPNLNYFGPDSFTYIIEDSAGITDTATVSITVSPVNDVPSFVVSSTITVAEDSGLQTILGWATSISPGPANEASQILTFTLTNTSPVSFTVQPSLSPTGTLTFQPAPDAFGIVTVTVTLKDSGGIANGGVDTSASQIFTISLTPVNDPPTAVDDTATVAQDSGPNIILVLANDTILPDAGETLTVTSVIQPANGIVANFGDHVRYAPNGGFNGTDVFTYTITDGAFSDTAVVTVTVLLAPTPTPTNTPITPTPTNTPVTPTPTNTSITSTPTNTPVTPTSTNTPITPTPTNTPITPTPTNTPITPTPTNTSVAPGPYTVYLPVVMKNYPSPDLIGSFSLSPVPTGAGQAVLITAVITNQAIISTGPFWVDFYINPSAPPTAANMPWNDLCNMTPCYGIAWYISTSLAPGQSLTLVSLSGGPCSTSGGTLGHYCADNTIWPGSFASGTQDLYLFVDSWNPGVPTGAVSETNEGNNRSEFHFGSALLGMGNFGITAQQPDLSSIPTRAAPPKQ